MIDLRGQGLDNPGAVHANLAAAVLVEHAVRRGEGVLADSGALVALTGTHTGRSPKDRYIVVEPTVKDHIDWGSNNIPLDPQAFARLAAKARAYFRGRELFVCDGWACADPTHRLAVRVICEKAWHALFIRCLLIRPPAEALAGFVPDLTILCPADLRLDPKQDGTRSDIAIALALEQRLVVIAGTHYAGEMKKSVFSALNYYLPQRGVFPMHCSANIGPAGDTALFFGLSGTGKTTLSADPQRRLIGDDEHGWSDDGVFNFEGGCYAKTIRLSQEGEPQIWNAIRFGSVVENVVLDARTRQVDFDSEAITENTRAGYPLDHIDNAVPSGRGGHPANLVFLACDAFGVLPPIARLTPTQAMYHFLSGYTAKVAGTEAGVTEPEATFSTCFGAPFMPLDPARYAELLRQRLEKHGSQVWLVNTGWTGGPTGVGSRMKLSYTRAMLHAALHGELAKVATIADPIFGVAVPQTCPGVPADLLQPRRTWKNPEEYDQAARHLAGLFQANFKPFAPRVPEAVRAAGPKGTSEPEA
jgi:phosphoenolpyruvate carboxykinase (ATP)